MVDNKTLSPWATSFFGSYYPLLYESRLNDNITKDQISFLTDIVGFTPNSKILDLCCGHLRHSIALAKLGFHVIGLDRNNEYLLKAKKNNPKLVCDIDLLVGDMRNIPFKNIFDVVINMFSSFGYMEEDKDNFLVLKQIFEGLKRGGRVVLDLQNREWVIANSDFNKNWDQNESGMIFLQERIFDLNKSRAIVKFKVIESKKSEPIEIFHSIRLYTLTEIGNMLKKSGFKIASVYGSYDGNKYVVDSPRMIVVAIKDS